MKLLYKLLIISVLCFLLIGCNTTSKAISNVNSGKKIKEKKKKNVKRVDIDDLIDEQMQDYELDIRDQNGF